MSAVPTQYEREFDFTNWSTTNPDDQQPGVQLDAEFNAIKDSLDQTQDRLAEIQRDDGELKNNSVGIDQLKSEVSIGVGPASAWAEGVDYVERDSVTYGNSWYICTEDHTSTASFDTNKFALIYTFPSTGTLDGAQLVSQSVALSKLAAQATLTFLANATGGSASPTAISVASARTLLGLSALAISGNVSDLAGTITPSDNTVAAAKIVDGAVTAVKIPDGVLTNAKLVNSTITAAKIAANTIREIVTVNRTYYVRTDGNDSNTGLTNDAGGAFLTIQKAVDTVLDLLPQKNVVITIQVADGTYSENVSIGSNGTLFPQDRLVLQGNTTTPANVIISGGASTCLTVTDWQQVTVKGLRVTTTSGGNGLQAQRGGRIRYDKINFHTINLYMIYAIEQGMFEAISAGSGTVSGSAAGFIYADKGAIVTGSTYTLTYSNTPAFSSANVTCLGGAFVSIIGYTFTNGNTVTGTRYYVDKNGVIQTDGAGATYIPGDVSGTATSGGQYT